MPIDKFVWKEGDVIIKKPKSKSTAKDGKSKE